MSNSSEILHEIDGRRVGTNAEGNLVINRPDGTQGTLNAAQVASAVAPNNRMTVLGDSYFGNGILLLTGTPFVFDGSSLPLAMNEYLGLPWDITHTAGAVGGTTTADWLANSLAGCVASDCSHAFVGFPNNDAQLIGSLATTQANLTTIWAALKDKRIKVATRGSLNATWTATQFGLAKQISDWIVTQAKANGWPIFDMEAALYGSGARVGNTNLLQADTNHPNNAGMFFAAAQSDASFINETARPARVANSPTNLLYNSGMVGAVSNGTNPTTMTIPGWANYNTGGSQTLAASKVARTDTQDQEFLRFQLTSAAINDRQGLQQVIDFTTLRANSTAYVVGNTRVDSNGNLQRCITAGTTAGSPPTWKTAIGDTTTDNTVTWERITNIVPGTSKITLKADYDITAVSGGDNGCMLNLLVNFTGTGNPAIRAHGTTTYSTQRHTMTKRRRPGLMTPPDFTIPAGQTSVTVFVNFILSAASVTATCDLYGLELKIT